MHATNYRWRVMADVRLTYHRLDALPSNRIHGVASRSFTRPHAMLFHPAHDGVSRVFLVGHPERLVNRQVMVKRRLHHAACRKDGDCLLRGLGPRPPNATVVRRVADVIKPEANKRLHGTSLPLRP